MTVESNSKVEPFPLPYQQERILTRKELDELLFLSMQTYFQFERRKISNFGLGFSDIYLLLLLARKSSLRVGDLARDMQAPVSTVSRMIGRLEKRELVKRNPDPKDRRIIQVSMVSKGKQTVKAVEDYSHDLIMRILSKFDAHEVDHYLKRARELMEIFSLPEPPPDDFGKNQST